MQSATAKAHSANGTRISTPPASAFVINDRFDRRYTLRRLLARSAGAMVYAAEHVFTRRPVAVKVPHDSASSSMLARVRREMEALALVRGEGVVEMLDAGEVGSKPYIVFELLEGRTLAGLLASRGQLSPDEVAKVGIDVARALEHCHERGVIHRDIKPSNLFVTLGSGGHVKVLDFGIAKLSTAEPTYQPKLTQETAVLGTPEYMAPEALMSMPSADHRVDIYGLGVTLYECLTGAVPFEGQYAEVLMKVSTGQTPSVQEQRPDAPEGLCKVIQHCLARDPAGRFETMTELRIALEASLRASGAPVSLLHRQNHGGEQRREPDTLADAPAAKVVKTGIEARKHPRAPYITLARITLANGNRIDGRIEEVSQGGLQFVGDRAIDPGSVVKIRFALPATGRIAEVSATARWNRTVRGNNASGFQFDEITEAARAEIGKYVEIVGRD